MWPSVTYSIPFLKLSLPEVYSDLKVLAGSAFKFLESDLEYGGERIVGGDQVHLPEQFIREPGQVYILNQQNRILLSCQINSIT